MTRINCIITGCNLLSGDMGTSHGDLWEGDTFYIFNAVCSGGDAMVWDYEIQGLRPGLFIPAGQSFFERRGVLIIPKENCQLNEEAKEYIR